MSLSSLTLLLLLFLLYVFFWFAVVYRLCEFVLLMTLLPYSFLAHTIRIQSFLMTRDTDIDGHMLGCVLVGFVFYIFLLVCLSCGVPYRMSNMMFVWYGYLYSIALVGHGIRTNKRKTMRISRGIMCPHKKNYDGSFFCFC